MNKVKFLRGIGVLQVMLSAVLAVLMVWAYSAYSDSLGGMSRSLSATMRSMSEAVGSVAATMTLRKEVLDRTETTLKASRQMISEISAAARMQDQLIRGHARAAASLSAILGQASATATRVGEGLLFPVPKIRLENFRPVIEWYRPLEVQSELVSSIGRDLNLLSSSVKNLATAMESDLPRISAAFVETSKQTLILIDGSVQLIGELNLEHLPKAIKQLNAMSSSLLEASNQIMGIEQLAISLFVAGVVLTALFSLNGIAFFLFAASIGQLLDDRREHRVS